MYINTIVIYHDIIQNFCTYLHACAVQKGGGPWTVQYPTAQLWTNHIRLIYAGLMYYSTTKFENDANRPSCFQQLQAVISYVNC